MSTKSNIEIPTFDQALCRVESKQANALDRFVYGYEPNDSEDDDDGPGSSWKSRLQAALDYAYESGLKAQNQMETCIHGKG